MASPYRSFTALFLTTLLMLVAQGSLATYLGLSMAKADVSAVWIGGMMSCYYVGLVLGSKVGHKVIARVGHIRAFVASAAIVSACAMSHALFSQPEIWLLLRVVVGMGMMCQYMVLESWLNEQAESSQRGTVFASYMIISYLGMIGGQMMLRSFPDLGLEPLLIISMCFSLCIVPIALTKRIHPAPLQPSPLKILAFWKKAPQSLTAITVAGLMTGSFYGLAPAYAASKGLSTEQVTLFMSVTILAGLLAQWPMGKISDRIPRSRILRFNAVLLTILTLTICLLPLNGFFLLAATFCYGILAFTIYPIATAFANQHIEQTERVALSAVILMMFGIGASIGPLLASALMQILGPFMLYAFISCCAFSLFLRLMRVNYNQKMVKKLMAEQQNAQFKMGSGDLVSSPLGAALDPRVDEQVVQEQMIEDNPPDETVQEEAMPEETVSETSPDENDTTVQEESVATEIDTAKVQQAAPEQADKTDKTP